MKNSLRNVGKTFVKNPCNKTVNIAISSSSESFCSLRNWMKSCFTSVLLSLLPLATQAAEEGTAISAQATAHGGGEGLSPAAPILFHIGPLPVTNTILFAWVIIALIFIIVRLGTSRMQLIPTGLQNVVEAFVEGLHNLVCSLLEPKVARWCFSLVATFFIFILFSNLMELVPGIGSFGIGVPDKESSMPFALEHVTKPFFRPPSTDANMTIAMALVFFVMSSWWALKYNGLFGLINHIFGPKGGMKGWVLIPLGILFAAVGAIEVISILIRPVALSMRLFGNIYGGESVLSQMLGIAFGLPAIPFYFFELMVGIVQALVFTVLSIAFISTECSHSEDGSGHEKAEGKAAH